MPMILRVPYPETEASPTPTNWALVANGASVTASSTWGTTYVVGNSIDNDDSTFHASLDPVANQTLTVDLGQARSVAAFRMLQAEDEGNKITAYKVQKSDNNSDWTDVYECASGSRKDERHMFTASNTARYWRFLATAGASGGGWYLKSFELWNVGRYPYATASSIYENYEIYKALDASDSTSWSSTNPVADNWLALDYGSARTFTGHRLLQRAGAWSATSYKIQTSSNGTDWSDAYTRAATAPADETITYESPISSRYLRIFAATGGANGWEIYTFAPTLS